MRKLSFTTLILLFSVFILWNSCKKESKTDNNNSLNPTESDTLKVFGLKEIPQSEAASLAVAVAPPLTATSLPPSVNLEMPPIGYQGSEGSCGAWASAYGVMSYHFFTKQYYNGTDLNTSKVASPEYVYNQVKIGDCSGGSYFVDYNGSKGLLNILQEQGVCVWEQMPYSDANGCSTQPNATQKANASKYKLERFERISNLNDINQLKINLLNSHPILIGARVDQGFLNAGKNFVWSSASGRVLGGHAMVICGYDDDKQAFKLFNSWGKSWGNGGYTWLSYNYFSSVVFDAYITYPKTSNDNTTTTKIISVGGDLNFGSVALNSTVTKTMFIINSGNTALNISSINLPTGYSANWNSGSIAAGGVQNVTVSFKPTTASTYNGTITINGDQTSGTNVIAVIGTGYNSNNDNLNNGLVAYYPFNGNANDESGNGNNGIVNGAILTSDRNGNANKAFSFDTGKYIQIPFNETLLPSETISKTYNFWLSTNITTPDAFLALFGHGNADYCEGQFRIILKGGNTIETELDSYCWTPNEARYINLPKSIADNAFHMITYIIKGKNIKVYLDKYFVGTLLYGRTFDPIDPKYNICIGATYNSYAGGYNAYPFKGIIDDVRIYNRELNESEIQQLYQSKK